MEKETEESYKPFQSLSAWFSTSVQPDTITKWREFGGIYETKEKADYLFSENSYDKDTCTLYTSTSTRIPNATIFSPNWIEDILISNAYPSEVPIGSYLLLPHYTLPSATVPQCTTPPSQTTPPQLTRRPLGLPRLLNTSISTEQEEVDGSWNCADNAYVSEEFQNMEDTRKQNIMHIDSLGTICMRFIDISKAQNIIIKKVRRSKEKTQV